MRTNFQMIRDFKDFKPKNRGFLTEEEVKQIRDNFELYNHNNLELQNLRDFIVLYYSRDTRDDVSLEKMDIMSGILGVIDNEKWNRGMEV